MKVVGTQCPTTFFYFSFKKEKVAKENFTRYFFYIIQLIFPSYAMPTKTLFV